MNSTSVLLLSVVLGLAVACGTSKGAELTTVESISVLVVEAERPKRVLPPIMARDKHAIGDLLEQTDNLASVPDESRAQLAAAALLECEKYRLPQDMLNLLEAYDVPSEQRASAIFDAIQENMSEWRLVCPNDGDVVIHSLASAHPEMRASVLFEACDLQRLGLIEESDVGQSDYVSLIVAHLLWDYLKRYNALSEMEKVLIRAMLKPEL